MPFPVNTKEFTQFYLRYVLVTFLSKIGLNHSALVEGQYLTVEFLFERNPKLEPTNFEYAKKG